MREFIQSISYRILLAILLIVLASYVGIGLGYPKEDVQLFLLPFFVLAVWLLPSEGSQRIPLQLIGCAMLLWLGAYTGLEGYNERRTVDPHNFVSRLDGDTTGLHARGFFQRYNEISRTYHLPYIRMLHRTFGRDRDAQKWLTGRKPVSFVVRSLGTWVRLVFNKSASHLFETHPRVSEFKQFSEGEIATLKTFGLMPFEDSLPVEVGTFTTPLVIVFQPEAVSIPNEPSELALHLISWVSGALRVDGEGQNVVWPTTIADRIFASSEASQVRGDWHSSSPLGLALYLKGTFELLELLENKAVNREFCREVVGTFYKAAGKVQLNESPELYAAVFNNAAVALTSCAEDVPELRKAQSWLEMALASAKSKNSRGARAALYNLESLTGPLTSGPPKP